MNILDEKQTKKQNCLLNVVQVADISILLYKSSVKKKEFHVCSLSR